MKYLKIMMICIITLFCVTAFSAGKNFEIMTKKDLPNQLGTFQQIELTTSDNQISTLYAAILNQRYHAYLHLHETKIQFFADYLDTLSQTYPFMIAINGGFYQPDFTPLGLFIYQGKKIKSLMQSSLFTSCVVINKDNKLMIETNVTECLKTDNAMQTGPLLIQNGKINDHLQALQEKSNSIRDFFSPHKRTILALTSENKLILIVTSPLSLIDAANFLQNNPDAFGATRIKVAVNLDGGSSTGMYIRFPDEPFYFHEVKHVKTFIFVE